MRVLFLDFDGPILPQRSYTYHIAQGKETGNRGMVYKYFDPCAVAILKQILDVTDAKLVISSAWRRMGYRRILEVLTSNGLDIQRLHKDWATTTESNDTRADKILQWVAEHPDVTSWVAVDDEPLADPERRGNLLMKDNFVQVTLEDGILHRHHGRMLYILLKDTLANSDECSHWPLENHNWLWCDGCAEIKDKWYGPL
jgi:hypothetical protein